MSVHESFVAVNDPDDDPTLRFIWLEITGKCQLNCEHCYADSGPTGTHGQMSEEQWLKVIDQAAEVGVKTVQFIGGEPTTYPHLPCLVSHTLTKGIEVEVFSNLVLVSSAMWQLFSLPGVRLATSYYSDESSEHDRVTKRKGSHHRTRQNIREAVRRQIPIRVGVIDVAANQRVDPAVAELMALGVADIGVDHLRHVGRGRRDETADASQLCGQCVNGVLAINADGTVWPCVFSRWLPVGDVTKDSLREILRSRDLKATRSMLNEHFLSQEQAHGSCAPDCSPLHCDPGGCSPFRCGPGYCRPGVCTPDSCYPATKCGPRECRPNDGACRPTCVPR